MEDKKILLDNIHKIHTTEMGIARIKRNLKIDVADVVEYCKNKVLLENCKIYRQGKNWYCEVENIKITINSYSYTIITAHIVKWIRDRRVFQYIYNYDKRRLDVPWSGSLFSIWSVYQSCKSAEVLAIIVRPEIEPNYRLERV